MSRPAKSKNTISRTIWAILPWIFLLVLLLILLALGRNISAEKDRLALEKKNAAQVSAPLVNVVVQEIVPTQMTDSIELPAITEPWLELMVKTEVAGKVISLDIKEGDFVEKGQVICQIDPRDYQNRYDAIAAKQSLAKTNFLRLEKLSNKSAVSASQLDDSKAMLRELEANLADASLELTRCSITAPISGSIENIPAKEGMLLAYADPVARILDISKLKLDIAIPESTVSSIRDIKECRVVFAALNNREVVGSKYFLSKQPSTAAMTYNLQLVLGNDKHDILPGMFARAKVVKNTLHNAIGIPLYTILSENDGQFVYVIKDDTAFKRAISTGFMEGWNIQIVSGLNLGDKVAIVGHRGLEDGQKVKIIKTVRNLGEITH